MGISLVHRGLLRAGLGVAAWLSVCGASVRADLCELSVESGDALGVNNLSKGAPSGMVVLGHSSRQIGLSPDGQRAYVSSLSHVVPGIVSIVDLDTLRVVDRIELPLPVQSVAIGSDETLYVTVYGFDSQESSILAIDPSDSQVIASIPLSSASRPRAIAVGNQGADIFVPLDPYRSIHAFDADRGTQSEIRYEQDIAVIDIDSSEVVALHSVPGQVVGGPFAHPVGDFAYVFLAPRNLPDRFEPEMGFFELWIIRAGEPPRPVALNHPGFETVTFSPDGTRAYLGLNGIGSRARGTVVDATAHTLIGTLPAGRVVGFFAEPDCVLLADALGLRRACLGDREGVRIADDNEVEEIVASAHSGGFTANVAVRHESCDAPVPSCTGDKVCLEVIGAIGAPGESVEIGLRLHTNGHVVGGVQNDLFVEPAIAIAKETSGRTPLCSVNAAINKPATAFNCLTPDSVGCRSLRSLVLSFADIEPLADGSLLYTCLVDLPIDTPSGSYRVACPRPAAATPTGAEIFAVCQESEVVVVERSGERLAEAAPGPRGGASGCQVVAPGDSGAPWLLPLCVISLALIMRRRLRR